MGKKLLIKTVAGNTIVDADSYVGSDLNGNLFAKRSSDINIGEKLYFEKQAIQKTLGDIEKDLMESPRYKTARNSLYINDQTALSYYLNNAKELQNLSENEKVNKIYDVVKDKISRQAVKEWVSGKTVMPEDKTLLGALAQFAPELKLYEDALLERLELPEKIIIEGKDHIVQYGAKYPFYNIYTNVRRGVMRYLSMAKNKGGGGKKEHKASTEHLSLGHEIDIVVSKYFNEISEQLISAKVTGIQEIERKKALKMSSENHEKLRKGVIKIKPDEMQNFLDNNNLKTISLPEIINDLACLEYVLGKFAKKLIKEKSEEYATEKFAYWIISTKLKDVLSPRNVPLYDFRYAFKKIPSDTEITQFQGEIKEKHNAFQEVERMGDELIREMTKGEYEVMEKLANAIDTNVTILPPKYMRVMQLEKDIMHISEESLLGKKTSKQQFFKATSEYKRLMRELNTTYGLTSNVLENKKRFKEDVETDKEGIPLKDEDGILSLRKHGLNDLIEIIFGNDG